MLFSKPGLITKGVVAASLVLGTSAVPASASNACQPGTAGCVLPLVDPAAAPPPPPVDAGPVITEAGGGSGIGIGVALAALAAAGLLAFVVFDDDDDDDVSPD